MSISLSLSMLADVATGNSLISGGVGIAPTWGKIGLPTHVSGTLGAANGGTGASTLTANKVLVGNGTTAVLQPTNLHWDNTNGRLGVGIASPTQTLHISGNILSTGSIDAGTQFLGLDADTIASPSFSWTGDTNTGMYHPGADKLGLVTAGVERVSVLANGNVGIGTPNPQSMLHVNGSVLMKSNTSPDAIQEGYIGQQYFTSFSATMSQQTRLNRASISFSSGGVFFIVANGTCWIQHSSVQHQNIFSLSTSSQGYDTTYQMILDGYNIQTQKTFILSRIIKATSAFTMYLTQYQNGTAITPTIGYMEAVRIA